MVARRGFDIKGNTTGTENIVNDQLYAFLEENPSIAKFVISKAVEAAAIARRQGKSVLEAVQAGVEEIEDEIIKILKNWQMMIELYCTYYLKIYMTFNKKLYR